MSIHYDEKGKFYTDIISKQAIPVLIQTSSNRIRGNIYVRPAERIKDQINQEDMFLAVTEAIIFDQAGEELYDAKPIQEPPPVIRRAEEEQQKPAPEPKIVRAAPQEALQQTKPKPQPDAARPARG